MNSKSSVLGMFYHILYKVSSHLKNLKPIYKKGFKALDLITEGALIKYLALLFFLIISFDTHANESLLKSLTESWNADYVSLACSDNMIRLHSRLASSDKDNAFIIHIFHKHVPHKPIMPIAQRLHVGNNIFKAHRWSFHAILYVSGFVLDLDYTNSPRPEEAYSYFKKMWPQKELLSDYRFQIKSANLYHRFDADGSMDSDLFPIMNFKDLKSTLSSL